MIRKIRILCTLIAAVVMIALAVTKYYAEKPEPYSVETYVVDDGNGSSEEVTYKRYDLTDGQPLDPKAYVIVMAGCTTLLAISCNFYRRASLLNALRKRCTVSVPAVVTIVKRAKADAQIRYRYMMYNATYQYEYQGATYESNNHCYGRKQNSFSGKVNSGDRAEIHIDPDNPRDLFDPLAKYSLTNSRTLAFILTVGGMLIFVGLMIR